MVEENFKKNGKVYFDIADIPKRTKGAVDTLTNVIQRYNQDAAPDEVFNRKRNEAADDLRAVCHKRFGTKANVYIFGSCINGFGTKASDVDCFILSKFDMSRKNSYMNPLLDSLRKLDSPFKVMNFVRRGNVPVITAKHRNNQMELDITFASDIDPRKDVLENSALLNTYAQKNTKIPAVGRFIKYVLSQEPCYGSAKVGGLSSYGHIIMYIYFLLHGRHKIHHVTVETPLINREESIEATEGTIFLDFLRFYACEFDSSKYAIDIRMHDLVKLPQNNSHSHGIFTLEDPIIEKNLGRTMAAGRVYEFKLFYYRLLCALSDHDMKEAGLKKFISELDSQQPSQLALPKLHPFCEPDKETDRPHNKRNDRRRRNKNERQKSGESDRATQNTPEPPGKQGSAATNKRSRNRKRNNKTDVVVNERDTVETTVTPESGTVFGQNDPYLLEDLMKEIETPEKSIPKASSSQQNVPRKKPAEMLRDTRSETAKLTKALLEENKKLDISPEWNVVNYMGTDVMGDSRYLIAVPLLAALGFKVPSIQVGNTASLEKLKCIPGFNPELKLSQMNTMLEKIGCCIGYSQDLNTVDSKMSEIMKSVGTLQSSYLDLARHFSLVAACGTTHYFADVKCVEGKGKRQLAFRQAEDIIHLAKEVGMKCRVQVSDSTVPYSTMLGYSLEIQDVIEVLQGEGSSDMIDVLALQCAHILQMTKQVESLKEGEKLVFDTLANGSGLTKFLDMISEQGVTSEVVEKLRERKFEEVFQVATTKTKIESRFPGIVRDIRLDQLERVVTNRLGGYGASGQGIQLHVDIGSRVNVGTCLITVHHSDEKLSPKSQNVISKAVEIEKVQFNRVLRTFRSDGNEEEARRRKKKNKEETEQHVEEGEEKKKKKEEGGGVVEEEEGGVVEEGAVGSSSSSESVPKDYVVVVKTENSEERTVTDTREE